MVKLAPSPQDKGQGDVEPLSPLGEMLGSLNELSSYRTFQSLSHTWRKRYAVFPEPVRPQSILFLRHLSGAMNHGALFGKHWLLDPIPPEAWLPLSSMRQSRLLQQISLPAEVSTSLFLLLSTTGPLGGPSPRAGWDQGHSGGRSEEGVWGALAWQVWTPRLPKTNHKGRPGCITPPHSQLFLAPGLLPDTK